MDTARRNGWEVYEYKLGGVLRGYAMVRGYEIHVKVLEGFETPAILRQAARRFIEPIFKRYGMLSTRVPLDDSRGRRFVERIGFRQTWSDQVYNYFNLTAMPFERH